MSLSIDKVKGFTLDAVRYLAHDIEPGDDPLDVKCWKCTSKGRWSVIAEICQWGIAWDCYVVLVRCENCDRPYAIRFHQPIEDFLP